MVARGEEEGKDAWLFGMDTNTLLCLKWISNKDLLYSTGDSAQCYLAAWMQGGVGTMHTCVCTAESLHCSPETITTLFVNQLYPNTKQKVLKI